MNIINIELDKKCWVNREAKKTHIVIHGSNSRTSASVRQGKLEGAKDVVDRWNITKEKFTSPYLINRDGSVVQTYPETAWSYALNIPSGREPYDQRVIGIELVNELCLLRENGQHYIQNIIGHQNMYTGPVYKKCFRKYEYWADLGKNQVDSLITLIKEISERNKIVPVFFDSTEFDHSVWSKATIFTHANVNKNVIDLPFNDWVTAKIKENFKSP